MVRLVLGVIVGYLIFGTAAVAIFWISGRDPHAPADPAFMVATIGAGIIAAVTGGYIGAAIARDAERPAGLAIALIIAGGAVVSLITQPGEGARWSQWAALGLMSPGAVLGALIRFRKLAPPRQTSRQDQVSRT